MKAKDLTIGDHVSAKSPLDGSRREGVVVSLGNNEYNGIIIMLYEGGKLIIQEELKEFWNFELI